MVGFANIPVEESLQMKSTPEFSKMPMKNVESYIRRITSKMRPVVEFNFDFIVISTI